MNKNNLPQKIKKFKLKTTKVEPYHRHPSVSETLVHIIHEQQQ